MYLSTIHKSFVKWCVNVTLSQANTILPQSHSHYLHCLPTLINMAASFEITPDKRL